MKKPFGFMQGDANLHSSPLNALLQSRGFGVFVFFPFPDAVAYTFAKDLRVSFP